MKFNDFEGRNNKHQLTLGKRVATTPNDGIGKPVINKLKM